MTATALGTGIGLAAQLTGWLAVLAGMCTVATTAVACHVYIRLAPDVEEADR